MSTKLRVLALVSFVFIMGLPLLSQTDEAAKIFAQDKDGVVSLYVYGGNKELVAKGVAFGLSDDLLLTSYHLVSAAEDVEGVNVKGKKGKIEGIVAADRAIDVALVKSKNKATPLPVGDSKDLASGARIFAIGANEAGDIIITEGTVRNLHKLSENLTLIESSLSIPDGFNGGPLLNTNGQVVGILLILDQSARIGIASNAWSNIPRTGKLTAFKDWNKEDYLATNDGAYLAGRVFYLLDNMSNAGKYLERVVKANPSLTEAQALLAMVYSKQRNFQSAVTAFQKVIELDPKRASAYFELGDIYFRMQKWGDAISLLEKGVALDPNRPQALFTIGNANDALPDFAKAADAYERFLKLNPENAWMGELKLGQDRLELEQYDQAVAALEQAAKAQPQDIKVNYTLAQAYQKAGQLEKAEATYENLAAINPTDAATYYSQIVKMYDEAGRNENAIEAAKKVIELSPKSEIAVFNLGIMYQKLKRYDEAIATFKQALQIKADYDAAYYNIGLCYSYLKNYKDSIDAFKNYVALVPDSADAWLNIGVGYMQLKQFEQALEPLKKAVELRPAYGAALYNLAITYLNLKDNFSARDVYKTLTSVDPDLAERLKKYIR
jgi:tetratricopeptide (TPR) repeat protein